MHAVIKTGGKQYHVKAGDEFNIEKIPFEKGDVVTFNEVLGIFNGDAIEIGRPLVEGATVEARVVAQGKAKKVVVFKKKRRKGYQVKKGHRQPFTRIVITSINA